MDDSTSLTSLNSADFILINKEQPRLKFAAGMCADFFLFVCNFIFQHKYREKKIVFVLVSK